MKDMGMSLKTLLQRRPHKTWHLNL
jgi:hypothetical protein